MSTHSRDDSAVPVRTQRMAGVWRGLLVGLIPLGLLAAGAGMTVLLTALARQLFAGSGFFAQQQAVLIVLVVGLILAIAVFAVAIWRVLRRVAAWQQSGAKASATLLALLLPQYPAP